MVITKLKHILRDANLLVRQNDLFFVLPKLRK